jgi:hypothetical protein
MLTSTRITLESFDADVNSKLTPWRLTGMRPELPGYGWDHPAYFAITNWLRIQPTISDPITQPTQSVTEVFATTAGRRRSIRTRKAALQAVVARSNLLQSCTAYLCRFSISPDGLL